jgi:hypothetical protein
VAKLPELLRCLDRPHLPRRTDCWIVGKVRLFQEAAGGANEIARKYCVTAINRGSGDVRAGLAQNSVLDGNNQCCDAVRETKTAFPQGSIDYPPKVLFGCSGFCIRFVDQIACCINEDQVARGVSERDPGAIKPVGRSVAASASCPKEQVLSYGVETREKETLDRGLQHWRVLGPSTSDLPLRASGLSRGYRPAIRRSGDLKEGSGSHSFICR